MRNIQSAIITGPTGAIGTALCRLLVGQDIKVYAVIRPGSERAGHVAGIEGVSVVECDISDLSDLPSQIPGKHIDTFYHFAWAKTTGAGRNDMDAQIDNVRYTLDACRTARDLGCQVFVGAGSQAEYGRVDHALTADIPCFPENGYGMAKLCAGQMSRVECQKLGIDHIWPRILSVYGPYEGENALIPALIKSLIHGETMPLTAGEQVWDYLYADDAAEALYRLALHGRSSSIYPVGSGKARLLKDYLEELRDIIDPSLPLAFGKVPYGEKQVMHLEADISALQADTGFRPKVDFHSGILKTIDYIKSTIYSE